MPRAVAPGTTIDRYRVEAVIGAGSMGDVYRGVDVDLHRKVALKILSERHRDNHEIRARFVREARAVAAISHPNVVQVFTTGTYDDRPYIAMELLDGVDLGSSVARDGPWDSLAAARAIRDAARGLAAAARAGLIHRDVKPTNLVLLQEGAVKVTDFGLAKPQDPGDEPALTAMGVVVGTPDYIAPEQARGERIDHRVDIYALGGTLYFLLAGVPPFRTGKPGDDKYLKVVARHLRNPAPDARERSPNTDPELALLARAMMAKRPEERPSYEALIAQLDELVARLESGGAVRASTPRPAPTDGTGGQTAPTPQVAARIDTPGPDRGRPVAARSHEGRRPSRPDARGSVPDDAPTRVDMRHAGSEPAAERLERTRAPRTPRWLVAVSWVAGLIFVIGGALTLLGPRGLGVLPPAEAPETVAPGPQEKPAAEEPPRPTPPPGMLLVTRSDGSPWFFAAAHPVRPSEYAAIFPRHEPARQQPGDGPITAVSFEYAQAFARSHGKRLLTAGEWRAAARVQGFERAGRLWEWVSDDTGKSGQHTTIHPDHGLATRDGANAGDVTFRLARDLRVP